MGNTATDRTSPLTWYPTKAGLRWVVDRGAVASDAQSQPAATVPWTRLRGFMPKNVGNDL
jgi:hypothetical protein